jgi:asparagine synthase (glutamine-hydrolysing)
LVEQINAAQVHRGPDHASVVEVSPFVLGNTRLAVRDPTPAGNQPFTSPDGSIVVVFNGEIYNFRELAAEHAVELRTGCDGEIIPLLWAREGPACLRRLRGMYAIAVVDRRAELLFLARDPFGIKPLHWRWLDGTVAFASEVRPLESLGDAPAIDERGLRWFLRFGSMPVGRSPFAGIEVVAPGACISFDAQGRVRDEGSTPALDDRLAPWGLSAACALVESVRLHLGADVPTALLLSAGVDSSLIAALAARLGRRLQCVTVAGFGHTDESATARSTAHRYGHEHTTVEATIDEEALDAFLAAMQRPTIDGLNTFLVCRAVHDAGYKVALSGLGADEAVGGYRVAAGLRLLPALRAVDRMGPVAGVRDRLVRVAHSRSLLADKGMRLLTTGGPRTPEGLVRLQRELFPAALVDRLLGQRSTVPCQPRDDRDDPGGPEPVPRTSGGRDGYPRMAAAELSTYLEPMLLADADAFSMASSVELRVPYLDPVFFAAATRGRRPLGKRTLVDQLGDEHLRRLARRPKTGFSIPMREWLERGILRRVVEDARAPDAPVWSYLDRSVGLGILHQTSGSVRWSEPWAIAVLDAWLRRCRR